MAFLKIMSGPQQGRTVEIERDETVIGRAPNCAVTVDDSAASSRHCAVTRDGRKYWIRDMGSTNGTLLNDADVGEARLKPGDVITAGAVQIMFGGTDVDVAEPDAATAAEGAAPVRQAANVPGRTLPTVAISPFGARRDNRWVLIAVLVLIVVFSLAALAWFLVRLFA